MPLTRCEATATPEIRLVFTIARYAYDRSFILRICFIQPDVYSVTTYMSSIYASSANMARKEVFETLPNLASGKIRVSVDKCEVAGRIAPYVISKAGLKGKTSWDYCNAARSRLVKF